MGLGAPVVRSRIQAAAAVPAKAAPPTRKGAYQGVRASRIRPGMTAATTASWTSSMPTLKPRIDWAFCTGSRPKWPIRVAKARPWIRPKPPATQGSRPAKSGRQACRLEIRIETAIITSTGWLGSRQPRKAPPIRVAEWPTVNAVTHAGQAAWR